MFPDPYAAIAVLSHQASGHDAPASALDALRVFSLSHRTCGLPALGGVVLHGDAARLQGSLTASGIDSIVLSTCNRFEIYWRATTDSDDRAVQSLLAAALPLAKELLQSGAVNLAGDEAARHLFRVCSGLESMVVGEAEILGQVRAAMEQTPNAGSFLRGVFTAAIRTGRGARATTGIANGAMSVASAAVKQLKGAVSLPRSRVLVIGAGETAAKVTRQIAAIGAGTLVIANRTPDRAEALAAAYGGIATGLESLPVEIAAADVVVCAANSTSWMITREHVANRMTPMVLVDLAMPPAIEPFSIPGVTRLDLPAIEAATAEYRRRREAEVPRVNAFIDRELEFLWTWARRRAIGRPAES